MASNLMGTARTSSRHALRSSLPSARRQQRASHVQASLKDEFPPLDVDTDKVSKLMEYGYSREEAEAEAAWDMGDVDPDAQAFNFEDCYSVDENLPQELKDELGMAQYGPPVRL